MDVEAFDRACFEFFKDEHERRGDQLYQWYRYRFAQNNTGVSPYDRAVAKFVWENCRDFERVVEIGAGAGQASALLAHGRMPTLAVEQHPDMLDMLDRLWDKLAQGVDTDLPKYLSKTKDFFPRRAEEYVNSNVLLCFISISHTMSPEEERNLYQWMGKAGGLIVGLTHFFTPRDTEEKRAALVERIRGLGFDQPVDIYPTKEWLGGFAPNHIVFFPKQSGH